MQLILKTALILAISTLTTKALDLDSLPTDDSYALKQAVEMYGGKVNGYPVLIETNGPTPEKKEIVIYFPTEDAWLELPVSFFSIWHLEGEIKIEKDTQGGSGPIFGIVAPTLDMPLIAFMSRKWSPRKVFYVNVGEKEVITEEVMATKVEPQLEWQNIMVGMRYTTWTSKLGEFQESDTLKGSEESIVKECSRASVELALHIGNFQGWATLPRYYQD